MTKEQYEDKKAELRDLLIEAQVRNLEEGAPESEVVAAQAAYDYHVANRDILITE